MTSNSYYDHIDGNNINHIVRIIPQFLLALPFVLALIMYIVAVILSTRHHKPWPLYRTVCWSFGTLLAVITVAGPTAQNSHTDFTLHMLGHLLLGMLVPLLMVLAAPMTLVLRTLSVPLARKLSWILRCSPIRLLTNPFIASFLNIGGLWLLYTTELYALMHDNTLLYLIVHFHVFAAGYLFTASIIYIDPTPHRISFLVRTFVFLIALTGHSILSKYIYAHPPYGVSIQQAEIGGMIMYYGGDIIDIFIIFILCLQWYKAARPRSRMAIGQPSG